jgi:histidinol-phosphate aminotransferase
MHNKFFLELATPGVQGLTPYPPGKPIETLERELGISNSIKLASNENPLGPSQAALDAIEKNSRAINYYPDGGGFKLCQRLAEIHKVSRECVTLGNGSNDILELATRAFLTPQNSAVYSEYSFAVYPIVVQAVGAKANVAKAFDEAHPSMPLGHDPAAMLASIDDSTRIVFIANPNNPTGTWLAPDVLHTLVSEIPDNVIVILDLAYNEYMDRDLQIDIARWLEQFPKLIITCTFSKIYALAGLRIGYAVSSPEIAGILNRVRQPFNTNLLAQAAALASLDDHAHVEKSVTLNNAGKTYLMRALDEMKLQYLPTMGNFISINLKQAAQPIYDALLRKGVIVRPVANYSMPEYIRVTIGTDPQNRRFIAALQEVLAEVPA